MAMKKPCHPSEPILRDWFGGFDLIVEGAADHLQVSAGSRSEICQGQAPVTTEMAVGLLKAIGSTLRFWIHYRPTTPPGPSKCLTVQHHEVRASGVIISM